MTHDVNSAGQTSGPWIPRYGRFPRRPDPDAWCPRFSCAITPILFTSGLERDEQVTVATGTAKRRSRTIFVAPVRQVSGPDFADSRICLVV